ncbi:MAG: DUF937 domain-containing protein [Merismopedia sp. SIO2A8]|nr:DUF937 domain-containing protein [Merismopedia sp. SIO2A8]
MGLLTQVMGVIQDPERQASIGQMSKIVMAAQQLGQANNVDASTMQQATSVIGGFVRSALQEKRVNEGDAAAQAVVQQGAMGGADILSALFTPSQQQQVTQAISDRTGLDASQVMSFLPVLLPLVMKMLDQGTGKSGTTAATDNSNPLLSAFLDGDGDGDVDISDMLGMASKFL